MCDIWQPFFQGCPESRKAEGEGRRGGPWPWWRGGGQKRAHPLPKQIFVKNLLLRNMLYGKESRNLSCSSAFFLGEQVMLFIL